MVTLYSTPTCARCKVAEAQLAKAGILEAKVDLTNEPEKLAELKERLGVPVTGLLDLPVLELNNELFGMVDLRNIIQSVN